jgi:hypothetical protein
MRDAAFARGGETLVGRTTLEVGDGQRVARAFATGREAAIVALMASGGVKASSGSVFIVGFDPRVQPTQCKRVAGYVPHELVPLEFSSFERYIEYRAALWALDADRALGHARHLLEHLDGVHESFAYPLVGALLADPMILVLDRPQAAYASRMLAVAGTRAIFSTHASESEAAAWT